MAPSVVMTWPDPSGPFSMFETYGWAWHPDWSMEDNLIALVLANRLNCTKFAGYAGGHCSAVLCRPPRPADASGSGALAMEVVGLGVNTPPHFAPVAVDGERAGLPVRSRRKRNRRGGGRARHREIHAEVQILARCARAGIPTAGGWMFIEMSPCWECCKALIAAGISRVVFQCFHRPDLDEAHRERLELKLWGRSMLAAKAVGMDFVPVPWSQRRDDYVAEIWRNYKASKGLDRAAVKAIASYDNHV